MGQRNRDSLARARPKGVFLLHFYTNPRYPLFRSGLSYVDVM